MGFQIDVRCRFHGSKIYLNQNNDDRVSRKVGKWWIKLYWENKVCCNSNQNIRSMKRKLKKSVSYALK